MSGRLREQHPIVGHNTDQIAVNAGEAGHDGLAVAGLELVQTTAVHQTGNNLVHIVRHPGVVGNHAVQFGRIVGRVMGRLAVERKLLGAGKILKNRAGDGQGVLVILGQMVGHP